MTIDELKASRGIDDRGKVDILKMVILEKKKKFPVTYINYTVPSQEGLHRMYVAAELFG